MILPISMYICHHEGSVQNLACRRTSSHGPRVPRGSRTPPSVDPHKPALEALPAHGAARDLRHCRGRVGVRLPLAHCHAQSWQSSAPWRKTSASLSVPHVPQRPSDGSSAAASP